MLLDLPRLADSGIISSTQSQRRSSLSLPRTLPTYIPDLLFDGGMSIVGGSVARLSCGTGDVMTISLEGLEHR